MQSRLRGVGELALVIAEVAALPRLRELGLEAAEVAAEREGEVLVYGYNWARLCQHHGNSLYGPGSMNYNGEQ